MQHVLRCEIRQGHHIHVIPILRIEPYHRYLRRFLLSVFFVMIDSREDVDILDAHRPVPPLAHHSRNDGVLETGDERERAQEGHLTVAKHHRLHTRQAMLLHKRTADADIACRDALRPRQGQRSFPALIEDGRVENLLRIVHRRPRNHLATENGLCLHEATGKRVVRNDL